ncbi:hypothetical protein F0A16_14160 [Salinicola corii]|uniref:Uncharacterized protein n=1 Tax=Salinicola corii TaxID=2606937 RepID=A0A640WCW9_9GAMM|nr:hypothetical protein [Salinicola corii]KAA0017145.1 hypothetical protein F0A16_14160 [Salinicola corii]
MFKSKKATDEWAAWYQTVKAKRDELSEADSSLSEAKKEREASQHALTFHVRNARHMTSREIGEEPSAQDIQALMTRLEQLASSGPKTQKGEEAQAYLHNVQQAYQNLQQAGEAQQAAGELKDERAESLAKVEGRIPKATATTLEIIQKDMDEAQAYRDGIAEKLASLEGESGSLTTAAQEAVAAQEKLEELEALAAIGYGDETETKAANTQHAKARTQVEKAQADVSRHQALQRGLRRKLSEANVSLAHLELAYSAAATHVHGEKLAQLETHLVEYLTGSDLTCLLEEIGRHRRALEEAQPGASYGLPPEVTVELPVLYFHPDRAELSGERRTVQPI